MGETSTRLGDQVIIVTGGNKGIGLGIAERLVRDGARVVITGRDREAGREAEALLRAAGANPAAPGDDRGGAAGEERCQFIGADNADPEQIRDVVASTLHHYGRINGLVNNVATMERETILTTEPEFLRKVLDINLVGAVEYARQVLLHMLDHGSGQIVTIGSTHAWSGLAELFPYSLSKGALLTLTHHIARNYARQGIRANWVTVGWIITPGEVEVWRREGKDRSWIEEKAREVVPLGRLQTPEEIGGAVAFLFSPEAEQITDTELDVTGGLRV
jgi:NAD(P)-dependent dehydrogenase (short-subunit alcohol dehydrogenase family)